TRTGDLCLHRPDSRRQAPGCQPRRRRRCLHHRFPARRRGHGGDVNTILIVTADDALRGRLVSALGDHSVFVAQTDPEALKTLRLIDIDVILRGGSLPRTLETFVASVKQVAPSTLTIAIGVTGDEEAEAADLVLATTFTQRELEGALRHVTDQLRLTREITALRSSLAPDSPGSAAPDQPWEGAAFARVLREFTRA